MATEIEFESKARADRVREDHAEYLCSDDDRRLKTVTLASDTPAGIIDQLEAAAISDEAAAEQPALEAVPLTEQEKRDLDFSRDGVNVFKARYLKGLGQEYGVDPFQHVDLAEIDGVEDARPILERARQTGGIDRGGGAQYDDAAAEREKRQRRQNAERHAAQECSSARKYCERGEEDACEFLMEACGLSREEAETILMGPEAIEATGDTKQTNLVTVGGDEYPEMEVTPAEAGALNRSWQGYKGAINDLEAQLAAVRESITQARRAFQAINSIRGNNDQPDLDPRRLNDLLQEADAIPASVPEPTRLDSFDDSTESSQSATGTEDTPEFAPERQGTLGVDVEPVDSTGEKQVTLTGDDTGSDSAALPATWRRQGSTWKAGPYSVQLDKPGSRWVVRLFDTEEGTSFDIATGIPDPSTAEEIAEDFTEMVPPDEIDFSSNNPVVMEAAAAAKKEVLESND